MPPKSSSVPWPTHRNIRTTARKSAPFIAPKRTSTPSPRISALTSPSSSPQDNHLTPPPPSTPGNATAAEFSHNDDVLLLSSPEKKSIAIQTDNSFPVTYNAEPQAKTLVLVSPNQIDIAGDETQEKMTAESSNLNSEVGIGPENLVPACGREVTVQDGVETLVGSEKAAVDADGVRIVVEGGKRKVFKRVKVIKKVVKRVIKKVPKGSLKSSETERVVNVGNAHQNIQTLETELNVSQSKQIENVDSIVIDSRKDEKFDPDPPGVENEGSKEIKVDTIEVENVDSFVEPVSPMETLSADNGDGKEGEGIQNQFDKDNRYFVEERNALSVEEGPSEVEQVRNNQIEDDKDGGDFVEDQNVVQVKEGASKAEDDVRKFVEKSGAGLSGDFVEDQNVVRVEEEASDVGQVMEEFIENTGADLSGDLAGDTKVVQVEEGAGEVEEVVKESVGNNGAGLRGGVEVSGEIEAIERRRQRQTEIFLGGLDKDTKEEDIRKVFEQVGEVTEVRLKMNSKTGKNQGFAFVKFASAANAKKALEKYGKVEICGKQCTVQPVGGNDTLFLGNINKNWKDHDVIKLLNHEGIEKIDQVTVKANPNNLKQNRGFAFVELETSKDAQIAYNKLQKSSVFSKQLNIKVAWAQPLVEPDEKEMLKVNVKVSLANPQKRSKQKKHVLSSTGKEHYRNEPKTPQSILKVHEPGSKQIHTSKSQVVISDRTNSTNLELIHLLRQQQASGRPMQAGSSDLNYHHSSSGSKRNFDKLDDFAHASEPRGFLRTRRESSPPTGNLSYFSHHIGSMPLPYFPQQSSGYTFESSHGFPNNPQFQTREQPLSFGHSRIYRR